MKKLLVGDSFMTRDIDYPGQHWSEMLPEYDVIMSPGYHTDDPAWQHRMATEVRQILTTVDVC